jgi:Homeodomain-like domain
MAPPQKVPLRPLTAAERTSLARLRQASSARVDRVRRAAALLAVAQGRSFAPAAQQAGFKSGRAVASLVGRFNERGLAALAIVPGRGRRPTSGLAARAQIGATAQRPPARKADGTATWARSTLERRLRRDGLPQVGATTIRRVLQAAGSS